MAELSPIAAALVLTAGLAVLVLGGDSLVRGAASLARKAGMRPLLVGLTVVAFGTSAPELVVSAEAVLSGHPTLALGNIVGSNIANVFLVLGLPALFSPIAPGPAGVRRNTIIGLVAAAGLIGFAATDGAIGFMEGVILFAGIIAYLAYMGFLATRAQADASATELLGLDEEPALKRWGMVGLSILVGVIALPLGAWMIVEGGVQLADHLGMPAELVGLTAVALGTSLPELAATIAAAARRQTELAIGNVLGSNIFNIFAVGGVAAMIGVIPTPSIMLQFDVWVMAVAALALLVINLVRRGIPRLVGLLFLAVYIGYIAAVAHTRGLSLPV